MEVLDMSEQAYEIPLEATPQQFDIALDGVTYTMRSRWNDISQIWQLDLYLDGAALFLSMPLVAGNNLLEQWAYLGIPGILATSTDGNQFAPPTFENLGTEGHLYWIV